LALGTLNTLCNNVIAVPAGAVAGDLRTEGYSARGETSCLLRWLKTTAILVVIGLMLCFRWVNFTLDRGLYGFAFSISGYSPTQTTVVIGSFGVVAAGILLCVAAAAVWDQRGLQAFLGVLLLLLMLWVYLRISLGDAKLLLALARQSDWWLIIAGHPLSASRIEPGVWAQLAFDTVSDRLFSGWYYLGIGWYIGTIAGLVLVGSAKVSRRIKRGCPLLTITAASFAALAAAFLAKPVLAQRSLVAAMNSEANGDLLRAKDEYSRAMQLDPWYALNSRLYERIGRLDEALGRTDSPEYELYSAQIIFDDNRGVGSTWRLASAILTLDHIAGTKGPIADAAQMSSTDMRVLYGLRLFQDGAFGSAVSVWNAVLEREPDNWLAAYYLTWGYPTINRYRDMAQLSERFLARCADPLTLGIFYNSLGNAQIELGDLDRARASYHASYKRDYLNNSNAISALIGP
jgi:hypothetical protein